MYKTVSSTGTQNCSWSNTGGSIGQDHLTFAIRRAADLDIVSYTADTTRIGHVDVIHDPMITTDGETDHTIFHDNMDSVTDGHSPEIGNGTVTVNGAPTLESGIRNYGVLSDNAGVDWFEITATSNMTASQGTVIFTFIPNWSGYPAETQFFWEGSDGRFRMFATTTRSMRFEIYDIVMDLAATDFTWIAGQTYHVMGSWYSTGSNVFQMFVLNTKIIDQTWTAHSAYSIGSTIMYAGNDANQLDGVLDNFKILDGCLLPYGAYFTGNGGVDTDLAHEDITFYLDFEGANDTARLTDKIGSIVGSITGSSVLSTGSALFGTYGYDNVAADSDERIDYAITSTNVNAQKGSLLFHAIVNNLSASTGFAGFYYDANNYLTVYMADGNGDVAIRYRIASTNYEDETDGTNPIVEGQQICYRLIWDLDNDYIKLFMDGVEILSNESVTGTMSYDFSNFRVGGLPHTESYSADIFIDDIYITNNPNTPQIPVILGSGPIYAPIKDVS